MGGAMMAPELNRLFVGRAKALLPLMEDDSITDILINGTGTLFVEKSGLLESIENPFSELSEIKDFIERLVVPLGRRIDAAQPYLDGRLVGGGRIHIMMSPIAVEGPLISIRKSREFGVGTFNSFGAPEIMTGLERWITEKKNFLICGATGTGKTTLLRQLLRGVEPEERLVVVEECTEITLDHPHVIHLEARPPSPDGKGAVSLRELIRNTLRMRPDRIILGECRGDEALDLLQAMNTGHSGSMCTIHANSARDALRRLETLVLMAGTGAPLSAVREWISSAIDGVVHLERVDGQRLIKQWVEVKGLEGDVYRIAPILGMANIASAGLVR